MIQVLPGLLLNSSTKRWYSLGSAKVQGKKSHLDASIRPISLSRFFRYLFRFFTMRFLRVSCNINHRNKEKDYMTFDLNDICSSLFKSPVYSHEACETDAASPHSGCESGLSLHVPPCTSDQNSPWASPHHTNWSPTLHHCEKLSGYLIQATTMTETLMWWWTDHPTHSLTSIQPGLWRRTSCMVLSRPHL